MSRRRRRRPDPDADLWAIFAALPLLLLAPTGGPRDAADVVRDAVGAPMTGVERARFSSELTLGTEAVPLPEGALLRAPSGDARVDWRAPTGSSVASFGVRDGRVAVAEPSRRRRWAAPYADAVVKAATGGRVEVEDAISLLCADVAGFGAPDDAWWRDGVVVARWDDVEVTVDPRAGRPLSARVRGTGDVDLVGVAWAYDGGRRPTRARVEVPRWSAAFDVRFTRWEAADVDPAVFDVAAPGFATSRLEAWPR